MLRTRQYKQEKKKGKKKIVTALLAVIVSHTGPVRFTWCDHVMECLIPGFVDQRAGIEVETRSPEGTNIPSGSAQY